MRIRFSMGLAILLLSTLPAGAAEPLVEMFVGGADAGMSPVARVHCDGLRYESPATHVLLVARGDDASQAVDSAARWFYADADAESKRNMLISVVTTATELAMISPNEKFPPASGPTQNPLEANATHLWRWLGMVAPDLVIEVRTSPAGRKWYLPSAEFASREALAAALPPAAVCGDDELAAALVTHAACETGTIPALRVDAANGDDDGFLRELLAAIRTADFHGPSPARRELQRRLDRSPREVAVQLSQHYGREMKQIHYIPALALVGRLRLGQLTGEASHLADVRRVVAPFREAPSFSAPTDGSSTAGHLVFAELADLTPGPERDRYVALVKTAADLAFRPATQESGLMPYHNEMSDALFMSGPILAEAGRLTGDAKYYDACLRHLRAMRELVLRDDGLYRHSPLDEAAWGRGNGFPALGLAWCLSRWPQDRADRAELLDMLRRHLTALLEYQDETGCWHQVIDHPDTYRELSCTCMITLAMARGIRQGWLDQERFGPAVDRAWYAIRTRVAPNGRLVDVCTGTGKQKSLSDYYQRPAILGPDLRGGAMALMVATELAED